MQPPMLGRDRQTTTLRDLRGEKYVISASGKHFAGNIRVLLKLRR
jgi:hypothetical protein